MSAFPQNYLYQLEVGHKSFQTWKIHEVIPFTGRETASKLSNLTRPGVHWKGMITMAQLPQNCYAGACAGGSFACNIYGRLRACVHSSIQTTVVLAESSIPATIPSKFKIISLQTAIPKNLTAHFLYKIEVVEIEYHSSRGNINRKRSKFANKVCLTRNLLDQIQQETQQKTGLSLRKTTESRARSLLLRVLRNEPRKWCQSIVLAA